MAESKISTYRDLLWTNPSPTSAYTYGTPVSSGANNYKEIEVIYKTAHVYNGYLSVNAPFVSGSHITLLAPTGGTGEFTGAITNGVRTISMMSNGALQIDQAIVMNANGPTSNNNYCIPYKIYGIKI